MNDVRLLREKLTNLPVKDDFDLWVLLERTRYLISRSHAMEIAQFDISPVQASVLDALLDQGGSSTMLEMSSLYYHRHNSMSTLINRMEKLGLVRKVKYSDKRTYQISITEKGKDLARQISRDSINMTFSVLTVKEKENLVAYLRKLQLRANKLLGLDFQPPFMNNKNQPEHIEQD